MVPPARNMRSAAVAANANLQKTSENRRNQQKRPASKRKPNKPAPIAATRSRREKSPATSAELTSDAETDGDEPIVDNANQQQ